jgi:hypothetical protein
MLIQSSKYGFHLILVLKICIPPSIEDLGKCMDVHSSMWFHPGIEGFTVAAAIL